MDTGLIAVVEQRDVLRETAQHLDLIDTQRRAAIGYDILDARLVHGNDVGITLDHEHAVFLHDGLLGLIDAVELTLLVIDVGVRTVHILLGHTLRTAVQHTTSKGHHLSRNVEPRENGATGVAVS